MEFKTPPPPRQPMTLETITVLGDLSLSASCSPSTDVDMQDTEWAEQHSGEESEDEMQREDGSEDEELHEDESDDQMELDDDCLPSIETDDHIPFLRGGILYPPPNMNWARKVAVASRTLQQIKEEDESYDDGDDDDDGDDGKSTSSDWDSYGDHHTVDEYEAMAARLEGNEDWNADQRRLHKLIYMRGLHPMMPSWWRVSFKMWGVTQPLLDDVFTPKTSKKRVAIHAYGNEVAAAKALESLFYLSQTVTDYEEIGYETSKVASTVVKCIRGYIRWAMRDVGIDARNTQLNMLVRAYPPDFRDDEDSEGSNFAPSPVNSDGDGEEQLLKAAAARVYEDPEADEAQRARRFTRAVSRDLERRLFDMGQRWRHLLRDRSGGKGYIAPPPTLYAFAVIQHVVLLASHDPSDAKNPVVVLEQVRLNDRGQWLWNALSLALPVNQARDALNRMWDTGAVVAEQPDSQDDPDL